MAIAKAATPNVAKKPAKIRIVVIELVVLVKDASKQFYVDWSNFIVCCITHFYAIEKLRHQFFNVIVVAMPVVYFRLINFKRVFFGVIPNYIPKFHFFGH